MTLQCKIICQRFKKKIFNTSTLRCLLQHIYYFRGVFPLRQYFETYMLNTGRFVSAKWEWGTGGEPTNFMTDKL